MSKDPNSIDQPHPIIGLLFAACGVIPILAAFDIGPFSSDEINGPPWLGLVAGGLFVVAGIMLMIGKMHPWLRDGFAILILGGMAAIGNWIAFGVGERVCSGSFSFGLFFSEGNFADLGCRIPFGLGALVVDAITIYAVVSLLEKVQGGPPALARSKKFAESLIWLSLSPLLLLMAILLMFHVAGSILKTRWQTGVWPRNEQFIASQQKKGLLKRFFKSAPKDEKTGEK